MTSENARSARRHKAWGVSPRNTRLIKGQAREAGDSGTHASGVLFTTDSQRAGGVRAVRCRPLPQAAITLDHVPGAHAPGFMLSCAPRTLDSQLCFSSLIKMLSSAASVVAPCSCFGSNGHHLHPLPQQDPRFLW